MNGSERHSLRFDADGLIPAVVQDAVSGDVLMLAYMNNEALTLTRSTRRAHFWSRGRSALWRKGEISGNEQVVEDIFVNCEQNSLLLRVRQTGAVCHEGFETCYFRSLNDDGSLTVMREQVFDPATVYGSAETGLAAIDELAEATRLQFGAYVYLRDTDVEARSETSRRLRRGEVDVRARIADELGELAGVLDGQHVHLNMRCDAQLEASQAIYWLLIEAIRNGATWTDLRPDRALATADDTFAAATISRLLRREAEQWSDASAPIADLAAATHGTLALIGQACRAAGVEPLAAVLADLAELRARPYLEPYFAGVIA
jgi:phosphoribosyl-AMP cyclohydrolase